LQNGKNEFRAVIKHLHMKGLTPKEIKAELDIHSTSASAFAITVYNWVNEFKRDRTSTCDALRPIEVVTPEIINIVLADRRVKMYELVEAYRHITWHSDFNFAQLGMKKLSARWVARLLMLMDHKRDRMTISKQCLEIFQRNSDKFLRRFITILRNMDPLLHTQDEGTIKTMDFIG